MTIQNPPKPVTTDANGQPTAAVQPKVMAATAGTVIGGAVTTIGVYIFEMATGMDLPTIVEGSILTLIAAGVTFAAGYIKRPSPAVN